MTKKDTKSRKLTQKELAQAYRDMEATRLKVVQNKMVRYVNTSDGKKVFGAILAIVGAYLVLMGGVYLVLAGLGVLS